MAFFVQAANLMTLFLGLEWFSIALYVLCAIDIDLVGSLEAGLKYLVIGAVGSATLLFGSALVYGATGRVSFDKIAAAGRHARLAARPRPRDDDRRVRLQGVGGAVPHVDAGRLPGRADAGDGVHGERRRRSRRSSSPTASSSPRFPARSTCGRGRSPAIAIASLAIGNIAALAQRNVKRLLAYSSVSHAGLHADRGRRRERARRAGAHLLPDPLLRDVARRLRASSPRASASWARR